MCLQNVIQSTNYISEFLASILFLHTVLGGYFSTKNSKLIKKSSSFILRYTQLILVVVLSYHLFIMLGTLGIQRVHTNMFGLALIVLSCIITLFGTCLLGERGLQKQPFQPFILLTFIWATIYMTTTTNLLTMFIAFELMFFPSAYYVYKLGYSKPSTKSLGYLAVWTYVGSFICLIVFAYIFHKFGTLHISMLSNNSLSSGETRILTLALTVGFGVKIPLWPFYYWLIKVHVDSPTGFSIFLSGFLVKTALYCFIHATPALSDQNLKTFLITWLLFGFIDSSLRMWETVDIKKLIALATVQEMNVLFMLHIVFQNTNSSTTACFVILHGLLSTLLFLLVDYTAKITGSRQATKCSGLMEFSPKTGVIIWLALLAFRGLPLFAKFFIEADLLAALIQTTTTLTAVLFLVGTFVAIVSFFRLWLSVLYGVVSLKPGRVVYSSHLILIICALALLFFCIVLLNIFYVSVFINN